MMQAPETLVELLRLRAETFPGRVQYRFLQTGVADGPRVEWTFADLFERANAVAFELHQSYDRGDRALLLYPPGLEFLAGLFGCMIAGLVAVPAYLPDQLHFRGGLERLSALASKTRPAVLLSTEEHVAALLESRSALGPSTVTTPVLGTDVLPAAPRTVAVHVSPTDIAYLQFTSGSTLTPRGVALSHANVVANTRSIQYHIQGTSDYCYCGWLPMYHDMGLIGQCLEPLLVGLPSTLMAPATFMARPVLWLKAISHYGGTIAASPDFGYKLCTQRVRPSDLEGVDLSTWTLALTGAEPVRRDTVEAFCRIFGPWGFAAQSFRPVYGLAEVALIVTCPRFEVASSTPALEAFAEIPAGTGTAYVANCGPPAPGDEVRIVDPERHVVLGEGEIGEIWTRGPSVASGYYEDSEGTAAVFGGYLASGEGPYLRTGDLGFLRQGDLFISGRAKDVIIVAGRNYYPQDLEQVAERAEPRIRASRCAAVSFDGADGPKLVMLIESTKRTPEERRQIRAAVSLAIAEAFGLVLDDVVVVPPRRIPLTSSGKLQRRRACEAYLSGDLTGERPSVTVSVGADAMLTALRQEVGQVLKRPPEEIDPDRPLMDQGIDSSAQAELLVRARLGLGLELSPVAIYNYPTLRALADHLAGQTASAPAAELPPQPIHEERIGVAIVAAAFEVPGASDLETLWSLLTAAGRTFGPVDRRWPSHENAFPAARWASLSERDPSHFDAAFFSIGDREARFIDPQQRILLELTWEALERAGMVPQQLRGSRTGVFVAQGFSDYAFSRRDLLTPTDAFPLTGNLPSMAAGRLSWHFGFCGPSVVVDTACSSSLVALHQACESLRRGECDTAIVGASNALLSSHASNLLAASRVLSPDGECRPFDARATGYVRAEGAIVLVLRSTAAAAGAGQQPLAIVRGSAVNHDGASTALTAPHGLAQRRVIEAALANANCTLDSIGYLEAHGTGTVLGDPVETSTLRDLFGATPCDVGSIKGNLGHLEAAAGLAGVLRALLVLQHGEVPPQAGLRELNPALHLEGSGISIPRERSPFRGPAPRRAGVSSFGVSGTNVHVVLEHPPEPAVTLRPSSTQRRSTHVLSLCARSPEALAALAKRHARALCATSPALCDWTTSVHLHRERLPYRLCVTGTSADALARALESAPVSPEGVRRPRIAFVCHDVATAEPSSGLHLYACDPAFRQRIEASRWIEPDVDLLTRGDPTARFTLIQLALADLLRSWGIAPAFVVGSGSGVWAAAAIAGALAPDLALRRSAALAGDRACEITIPSVPLRDSEGRVVTERGAELEAALRESARGTAPVDPTTAFTGADLVLVLGPGPTAQAARDGAPTVPCLAAGDDEASLAAAVRALDLAGVEIDYGAFHACEGGRFIPIPTYPFQHRRHWIETSHPAPAPAPPRPQDPGPRTDAPLQDIVFAALREVAVLKEPPTLEATFDDLGVDSVSLLSLHALLEQRLKCLLPVERAWEIRTLGGLIELLEQTLGPPKSGSSPPALATAGSTGTPWFRRLSPQSHARRLLCLPFVGGTPSAFVPLVDMVPETEVLALDLPGRAHRRREPLIREFAALLEATFEALLPLLDRPYVLYGHSMGGILGFELTRRLARQGLRLPEHLVLAAIRSPALAAREHRNAPDQDVWTQLQRFGGLPPEILAEDALRELLEPLLQADLDVLCSWTYDSTASVDVPLTAIGGRDDLEVPRSALVGWAEHTTRRFTLELVPGNHFFIQRDTPELRGLLRAILEDRDSVARPDVK